MYHLSNLRTSIQQGNLYLFNTYTVPEDSKYHWSQGRIKKFITGLCEKAKANELYWLGQYHYFKCELLDGTQRTLTMYMLLIALRNVTDPDEDRRQYKILNQMLSDSDTDLMIPIITLENEDDMTALTDILNGNDTHASSNIYKAFSHVQICLDEMLDDEFDAQQLFRFIRSDLVYDTYHHHSKKTAYEIISHMQ